MTQFLKIVDLDGDMQYINPRWIVAIRPGNRKSFRDSGAEIKVHDGKETKALFTPAGEATDAIVAFLGLGNG
ncbi:MAG TPA: hypothetical protein VGH80_10545 [Xanthomonadaceae bacterium]